MTAPSYVAEPPFGQLRHTTNAPNLHKKLTAVSVSTTILAFIAVVLRVFTRVHVTKNGVYVNDCEPLVPPSAAIVPLLTGVDAYFIILAMIFSVVLLGCNFPHMKSGLGYHMWDVKSEDFVFPFQVWTLLGTIIYATSLAFTKLSILLFYLQLSPQQWFRILEWILIVCVIAYVTVYDLISILGCDPITASWDMRLVPTATCMDQLTKYMALSILNIIIDILTLILPIPVVMRLQMATRQKITVLAVSLPVPLAIQRRTLLKPLMASTDYTWDAVGQFQWCFAEVNAAIVCACAPALKPFCTRYLPGLFSAPFRSYGRGDRDYGKTTGPSISASHGHTQENLVTKHAYELQLRDDMSEETG